MSTPKADPAPLWRSASPFFLALSVLWLVGVVLQVDTLRAGYGTLDVELTADPDGLPRVVALGEDLAEGPLRVGDRLLAVDGVAQQGAATPWGRLRAEGRALAGDVGLRVEREGAELELRAPVPAPIDTKLPYLLLSLSCGLTGLAIGVRALRMGEERPMADALLAGGCAFLGPLGSPLAAGVSILCSSLAHGLLGPLSLRGLLSLNPEAVPRGAWYRPLVALLTLRGFTFPASFYGVPGLPDDARATCADLDRLLMLVMAGLITHVVVRGYRIADESLRRRARLGTVLLVSSLGFYMLNLVAHALGVPSLEDPWRELPWALLPLGLFVGDLEEYGVEQRVTGAVAAAAFGVVGLGAALLVLPRLVAVVSDASGLATGVSAVGVAAVLIGGGVPLARRVGPWLEGLFFPARSALRTGTDQLLRDLTECREPHEVAELLHERLAALLRPRILAVYMRDEEGLAPVLYRGSDEPPRFAADSRLAEELAARPGAASFQRGDPLLRPDWTPADRRLLRELDPAVLLPVRRGKDLGMVVSLGASRSGDRYAASDLSLLSAVAEGAGQVLRGFDQAAILDQTRLRVAELARAGADQSRFLASASHDLRQPLGALGLLVEGLGDRVQEPETQALVARIRASVGDMKEMFEGVLDVSKLEAGAGAPEVSSFPLQLLLERLQDELLPEARAAGLSLRMESTEVVVDSDPLLLRRILQNLLTNALKYTRSGGVSVAVRRDLAEDAASGTGDVWIDVVDTGPGLSAAEQEQVFAEWVRAPADSSGEVPGLGLGLSIVRRLAGSLGHRLAVSSQPGSGSRFSVRVPVATAPRPARAVRDPLLGLRVAVVVSAGSGPPAWCEALRRFGCEVQGVDRVAEVDTADLAFVDASDGKLDAEQAVAALRDRLAARLPVVCVVRQDAPTDPPDPETAVLRAPPRPARLRAVLTHLVTAERPSGD